MRVLVTQNNYSTWTAMLVDGGDIVESETFETREQAVAYAEQRWPEHTLVADGASQGPSEVLTHPSAYRA